MDTAMEGQCNRSTPNLPPELYQPIFDNFDSLHPRVRQETLKAGALTNTLFRDICQRKLFEVIRIRRGYHFYAHHASHLLAILQDSPRLLRYIKAMHIIGGVSKADYPTRGCDVCDQDTAVILGSLGYLRQLIISSRVISHTKPPQLRWNDLKFELRTEIVKRCQSETLEELILYDTQDIPTILFCPPSPSLQSLTLSSVGLPDGQLHGYDPPSKGRLAQHLRGFSISSDELSEAYELFELMASPSWTFDLTRLVELTLHYDFPSFLLLDHIASFFSGILRQCLGTLESLTLSLDYPKHTPFKEELELLQHATRLKNFELRNRFHSPPTSETAVESIVWYTSLLPTIPRTTEEVDIVIEVPFGNSSTPREGVKDWDQFAIGLLHLAKAMAVTVYFLVLPSASFNMTQCLLSTLLASIMRRNDTGKLELIVVSGERGSLWKKEGRRDFLRPFAWIQR